MKAVNPDAGAEMMAACWLFEELCVPFDFGTQNVAAQAIRMEATRMGGIEKAAKVILSAARYAQNQGDTINRFWFIDQKYLKSLRIEAGAQNQAPISDADAYATWQSMSEKYRKANPWRGNGA